MINEVMPSCETCWGLPIAVGFLVMFPQWVFSKIIRQVAPNAMDVIGFILRVIVFHQKTLALDAIIMTLTRLELSCPGEIQFVIASFPDRF